jgi:hypothetical protein
MRVLMALLLLGCIACIASRSLVFRHSKQIHARARSSRTGRALGAGSRSFTRQFLRSRSTASIAIFHWLGSSVGFFSSLAQGTSSFRRGSVLLNSRTGGLAVSRRRLAALVSQSTGVFGGGSRSHISFPMRPNRSNQPMKPTAPFRNKSSLFATTPCRGLSPSRYLVQLRGFILLAAMVLSSCSHLLVGQSKVFGHTKDVSFGDLQAVVDAFHAERPDLTAYQIQVINRNEMHVFWYKEVPDEGNYMIFQRKNARWHYKGVMIVTS